MPAPADIALYLEALRIQHMEAAIALTGQVAGRIDQVRPVADIIADTVNEFASTVAKLAG